MTLATPELFSPRRTDASGLQASLRAAQPGTLLVPAWMMNAVVTHELDLIPGALHVPDEQLFVIDRDAFVRFIEREELPLAETLPADTQHLFLLQRPDETTLSVAEAADLRLGYWRLLLRAEVERQLRVALTGGLARQAADLPLPATTRRALDVRIDRVGSSIFNEARHVLVREKRIASGADDLEAYVKFGAMLFDLRRFAPSLLPHVFPALHDPAAVETIIRADLTGDVYRQTCPLGAADPLQAGYQPIQTDTRGIRLWQIGWRKLASWWSARRALTESRKLEKREARDRKSELLHRADRASNRGNDVGAALLRAEAHRGERRGMWFVSGAASKPLDRLVDRLAAALSLDEHESDAWRRALRPLLGPASTGWWSAERRLLYDLQRVCVDHERELYNTSVVEWLLELCRRPLFRPLPLQKPVLVARHLRAAEHRLTRCRLPQESRRELEHLFHAAVHHTDHRLRHDMKPGIFRALDAVGMRPRTTVESVARETMADEMVDLVIRDGSLNFAGLRDTISRNVLRCEDLRGPIDVVGYDQLMRLDRQLGDAMDGVYRRGELYRYGFQKFSSLLFATPLSRFLTRLLVMPVVGAVVLVAGFQFTILHLLHGLSGISLHLFPEHAADFDGAEDLPKFIPTALMAVFLLLVINWPTFRRWTARAFKWFFRQVAWLLFELPGRLVRNPLVRWVMRSRKVRMVLRYGVKPLAVGAVAWWLLPHDSSVLVDTLTFGVVFVVTNIVLNSRQGRAIEQEVLHALRVGWVRFTADLIGSAVRGVMRFFERMIEAIDRMLYAVDEWLRFRSGQKKRSLWGKAALSVVWFYVAYVFRFAVNLLLEPQINPIKHFPVVTVSHKLLLPLAIPQANGPSPFGWALMQQNIVPLTRASADATAGTIVWGIPGIFGFLAWELKENWKLYRANLPHTLRPVHFGSHGESIAQLLRPGFHSGTLPKAYGRIRKAHHADIGRAPDEGMEFPLAVHKPLEAIHHVEENIRQFVERAFLRLLNRHPLLAHRPTVLRSVEQAVTHISITFGDDGGDYEPCMMIRFEQVHGWIVASTVDRGWLSARSSAEANVVAAAIRGLFKMAAVDIVREDIDRALAAHGIRWELTAKQLLVRVADSTDAEPAIYWLHERVMHPKYRDGSPAVGLPILNEEQVLLRAVDIAWADWVEMWEPSASVQGSSMGGHTDASGVRAER